MDEPNRARQDRRQDRTEANEPTGQGKEHAPYAQMPPREQKEKAPGIDEHDAAGQGLSG